LLLIVNSIVAQNCDVTIKGYVNDAGNNLPLELVNIYVEENEQGTSTDSTGFFQLNNFCEGHYHFVISHIGCQAQFLHFDVMRDTILYLFLDHSGHELEGVIVTEKLGGATAQNTQAVGEQSITENANQNLSTIIERIAGVSTLKNGTSIAKPVVHGLYGNRLNILNNGILQSGQQWGNDHSPEIDPLIAGSIIVKKGVSALEYPGSGLGGVVLIKPAKIRRDPHLHGKLSYFFESNGLGSGLNVQLEQFTPKLGWKINGTLKKSGDRKTANYFLNNTGSEEANLAIQLEKAFSNRLFANVYVSTFNTNLGVLRGSHIGNLTDLEDAFDQNEPFYTEPEFSYAIEAPKQNVHHHLLKIHSKYFISDHQWIEATLAGQLNQRKEFDIRRGGRTNIPALSLRQLSNFNEVKFQGNYENDWMIKTGVQFNFVSNLNNPETGIFPLIPDYFEYKTGIFVLSQKTLKKSFFELGLRYDNVLQKVATFARTFPQSILRYSNIFHNFSVSAGWQYKLNQQLNFSTNLGYITRNPAINELYAAGLHQGVSGIEEGKPNLKSEQSIKATAALNGKLAKHFSFELLGYLQQINNYIYLKPQGETRLTIRGAFPVFRYEQTNARIAGVDVSGQLKISDAFNTKILYSFIKGISVQEQVPLINMPSNNITASVNYAFPSSLKLGKNTLENMEIEISDRYVFEQNHLLEDQDFTSPPKAYNLVHLKLSAALQLNKSRVGLYVKADNLFNVTYRDYLNRQRYFANDLGINIALGAYVKF